MLVDRWCKECQSITEDLIEKMEDSEIKTCPTCKKLSLERVLHYSNNFSINGYSYRNGYSQSGH
jgi:predicted nucleic acid-binding Zn ribbon protein